MIAFPDKTPVATTSARTAGSGPEIKTVRSADGQLIANCDFSHGDAVYLVGSKFNHIDR